MNRGAWWATVHGVAKSRTQLSTSFKHLVRFRRSVHPADRPSSCPTDITKHTSGVSPLSLHLNPWEDLRCMGPAPHRVECSR